jgi:hypothetical protein
MPPQGVIQKAIVLGGVVAPPVPPTDDLTLIQAQTIAGSAVQDVTFASLNGDVDEIYLLIFRVKNAYNGAIGINLLPNNVSTNQTSYYHVYTSGHTIGSGGGWGLTYQNALNTLAVGKTWIYAKTGFYRFYIMHGYRTGDQGGVHQSGHWTDTATNITSLVLHSSQASSIAVGSSFYLYKPKV